MDELKKELMIYLLEHQRTLISTLHTNVNMNIGTKSPKSGVTVLYFIPNH